LRSKNVNLWQARVAATACYRASGHAEQQDDGCAQQVPERAPTRSVASEAPDPGVSNNGRLVNFCDCHPCDRLEAVGARKSVVALSCEFVEKPPGRAMIAA
jgi:hypothetical protein